MRRFLGTMLLTFGGFMLLYALGAFIGSSRFLARSSEFYRKWSSSLHPVSEEEWLTLKQQAIGRVERYQNLIKEQHLEQGMIVNRDSTGQMRDQCDSLLFSSIWAVSLHKLGMAQERDEAWEAISKSKSGESWARHPRCKKSTSRDMLLGLLMAISTRPQGFESTLTTLVNQTAHSDGFFSDGPVYVSYMSPGIARIIDLIYRRDQLAGGQDLPPLFRDSYSTAEFEVILTDDGYASHLGALTAWLELELTNSTHGTLNLPPSIEALEKELIMPFSSAPPSKQRLEWITEQLIRTDTSNMFYRYLRLKAAGALTRESRAALLRELLAMPQFPTERLPMNCDRKADYMWQRSRIERAEPASSKCTLHYSGVDFLWMAALLLTDE